MKMCRCATIIISVAGSRCAVAGWLAAPRCAVAAWQLQAKQDQTASAGRHFSARLGKKIFIN